MLGLIHVIPHDHVYYDNVGFQRTSCLGTLTDIAVSFSYIILNFGGAWLGAEWHLKKQFFRPDLVWGVNLTKWFG